MRSAVSAILVMGAAFAAAPAIAQLPVSAPRTAYTVEPHAPAGQITIQGSGVRLRAEPFAGRETQVLSSGSTGLVLNVVGISRMADWNWYQVILKNGQKAFIRSDFTSAPSKGGGAAAPIPTSSVGVTPVAAPPISAPPISAPVYPVQPVPPVSSTPAWTPTPAAPTPTPTPAPSNGSGSAISLVPVSPFVDRPVETPPPNTDGLISVEPSLPPR